MEEPSSRWTDSKAGLRDGISRRSRKTHRRFASARRENLAAEMMRRNYSPETVQKTTAAT
jgi:hypothetical protein